MFENVFSLFVFVTLMTCCNSQNDCMSIVQRHEAVVNRNTTLDCIIGPGAIDYTLIWMFWSSRNLTSGKVTLLSDITGYRHLHVIVTDYSTKVNGSFSPEIGSYGAFTLLIHSLTLEDDASEMEWICDMSFPLCGDHRRTYSMIITGT